MLQGGQRREAGAEIVERDVDPFGVQMAQGSKQGAVPVQGDGFGHLKFECAPRQVPTVKRILDDAGQRSDPQLGIEQVDGDPERQPLPAPGCRVPARLVDDPVAQLGG